MKKTFSILSMMLLGYALYAGPVTPEKALQVAQRVFASAPVTKATDASSLQIIWDGEFEPATKSAQDPAFYVVSRPEGGFVIVAGNDNVQPVLAFSFENDFKVEGMPENVRWWMAELKGYARSAVRPTVEIEQEWSDYLETKAAITDVTDEYTASRTNLWSQEGPANQFTPTLTCQTEKSVCGCVPLALAEIMAWFGNQNKNSFSGTVVSYTYKAYNKNSTDPDNPFDYNWTIPEHYLATTHDWASLKNLASYEAFMAAPTTDETLSSDLGHLVYDLGTILQVEYNQSPTAGGTSGNLGYLNRLTTMMGYNQAATPKRRENYTASEWLTMLVDEIYSHPVFYDGQSISLKKGGHAFVADGYATKSGKKVIHFNFGWGGTCNGYYDCIQDIETANGYNFFASNSALFGFTPDVSGTTTPVQKVGYFFDNESGEGGITLTAGHSTMENTVYIDITNLENNGSTQYTGYVHLTKVDKTGAWKQVLGSNSYATANFNVGQWFSGQWIVSAVSAPVLGDKYALFYQIGSSDMKPVEGGSSGQVLSELPVFPAACIKREASYAKDDYFVFELTNHGYRYGNATWSVTTPGGVTTNYSQGDYRVQLTEAGEYRISCTTPGQETVVTFITVTAP